MIDTIITLVFMMAFLAFAIWPAIKIVGFIEKKAKLSEKMKNLLMLIFTVSIALSLALFMKMT